MAPTDEDMRQVLSNYYNMQSRLTNLAALTLDGKASEEVAGAQESLDGFSSFLSLTIPTKLYNERRAPNSGSALRVFLIPELLEMILQYATIFDILHFSGLCRGVKAIIDASPKLQKIITNGTAHTGAQTGKKYQFHPLSNTAGIEIDFMDGARDRDVAFRFTRDKIKGSLPAVGEVWKRMQLSHPPVTYINDLESTVSFTVPCCDDDIVRKERRRFWETLRAKECDGGVTLGELYDKANEMFNLHDRYGCKEKLTIQFEAYNPFKLGPLYESYARFDDEEVVPSR